MNTSVIKGLDKADAALKALDNALQRKIIRKGLRDGAKTLVPAAQAEAPAKSGLLRSKIKVRSAGSNAKRTAISVGAGAKDFTGKAFYAAFVLYGHLSGKRATHSSTTREAIKAASRKRTLPNNFLERAFEAGASNAADTTIQSWKDQIEDQVGSK